MSEFRCNAPEIVPSATQYFFDLVCWFIRKGAREVGAADPMLFQSRAERAHEAAGEIRHAPAIGGAQRAEHADGEAAEHGVCPGFELPPDAAAA
jgi:hypothetical protein